MNSDKTLIKTITYLAFSTVIILLFPFIAMQFSEEVVWTLLDFIFAGTLIFGSGLTYLLITRNSNHFIYRVAVGVALFTGFFLIWSNLAVGIVGPENDEFNLLYFLVIGVGVCGAFIARFKPVGLMYTLFAMAVVQVVIAAAAFFTGMAEVPESSVYEILAVNGFFITFFVIAAMLFRYAAQKKEELNKGVSNKT